MEIALDLGFSGVGTQRLRSPEIQEEHRYKSSLDSVKREPRAAIHSFHRYFGKLVPAIPRMSIREFTHPGDKVLDPFCGSGTTVVEAALAGRAGYGVDLNPLAVLITRAKTAQKEIGCLLMALDRLTAEVAAGQPAKDALLDLPYCVNMSHWFRPDVIRDLMRLKEAIGGLPDLEEQHFFMACFAAVLRDVSNADPRHVFPGYSKRMRALDEAGKRRLDVWGAFVKGARRRIRNLGQFQSGCQGGFPTQAFEGTAVCLPPEVPTVDLVVTNPPYISSIRYLETLKLELHWLGMAPSREAYLNMDRRTLGTERFYRKDYAAWAPTDIVEVDRLTMDLFANDHRKMSCVVGRYFSGMRDFFREMARVLHPSGHLVMKISDSFVREFTIPTHEILPILAKRSGFDLLEAFPDQILSRSLLTKRNSFSKMIPHDWILIWRQGGKGG